MGSGFSARKGILAYITHRSFCEILIKRCLPSVSRMHNCLVDAASRQFDYWAPWDARSLGHTVTQWHKAFVATHTTSQDDLWAKVVATHTTSQDDLWAKVVTTHTTSQDDLYDLWAKVVATHTAISWCVHYLYDLWPWWAKVALLR